ncbi:hypothetical protein SLS53_004666 [Cytospora paraplurivora]|uniref:Uncharacterized protein n=1 Tax=Cytospora paraplurivora TaxID=2898453 RepID=A0AAN9U7J9_9PEZI
MSSRLQSPDRPTEQSLPDEDDMGLTGEGRKAFRQSAPQLHPIPPETATEDSPSPETTPKRLVRSQTADPTNVTPKNATPAPAPARLSLLSMFTRNANIEVTPAEHEELLNMKVEEALFPAGSSGKDTFSPAAYKNLQQQATGLLSKMQNAYRQKAQQVSHLEKEREADRDELEEAETRATHLKFQLEDMAYKAAEQEQRMKQLMEELAAERRARVEEKNSLLKRLPAQSQSEAGSTISEDLGVDDVETQKRKWRKSNGTDTSFETDDDSISLEGESVFSRPRSPSTSTYTTTRGVETGSVIDMPLPTPSSTRGPAPNRNSVASSHRKSTQQMSTFQKLMKGISGDGSDACRNCKGQDTSMAWETVSLLRDENKHLKSRVGELEDCLEGALDVVNGIGL